MKAKGFVGRALGWLVAPAVLAGIAASVWLLQQTHGKKAAAGPERVRLYLGAGAA